MQINALTFLGSKLIWREHHDFSAVFPDLEMHNDESHLDKYVEAQAVDVVDVAQSKQAGEQAAGQHAHRQVQPNRQALPDDAAAQAHSSDITLTTAT